MTPALAVDPYLNAEPVPLPEPTVPPPGRDPFGPAPNVERPAGGAVILAFTGAARVGAKVEISGSTAFAFSTSLTPRIGAGVAGASTLTFDLAARPTGDAGSLAGTVAVSFAVAATPRGTGSQSGAVALTLAPAGILRGAGQRSGSATLTFSTAATGLVPNKLYGITIVAFTTGAKLGARGALAGTGNVAVTASAGSVSPQTSANVKSLWTGHVTATGAMVTVDLADTGTAGSVRLAISTASDLSSPVHTSTVAPDAAFRLAKLTATGLTANTQYHYGVEVDGVLKTAMKGQFKTLPSGTNVSCRLSFGSCSDPIVSDPTASFSAILGLASRPLMHLHIGDFHYANVANANANNPTEGHYQVAMDALFANTVRHQFHREIPTITMWDDHDFGGNNYTGRNGSNGISAWTNDALDYARRRFPQPQASGTATNAIYFSFVIGRLRFIMSDLRSWKTAKAATDNANKTMMGATQKAWFKAEITAAAAASQAVVWCNPQPWRSPVHASDDDWGSYNTERVELANHMKAAGLSGRVLILTGDMHASAIWTGTDYATGGGFTTTVWHGGPMANEASYKGGTYDVIYPANAQQLDAQNSNTVFRTYNLLDIADDGSALAVNYKAISSDGTQRIATTWTPNFGSQPPQTKTCWDGSVIPIDQQCPPEPPPPPPTTSMTPRAADDVTDFVAVCVHGTYPQYESTGWQQPLLDLGVRHIRGLMGRQADDINRFDPIFAAGMKVCSPVLAHGNAPLTGDPSITNPTGSYATAAANIRALRDLVGAANVSAIEGLNEYNKNKGTIPTWATMSRTFSKFIYDYTRSIPAFNNTKLIPPSIYMRELSAIQELGDLSPWVDDGCAHYYTDVKIPTQSNTSMDQFIANHKLLTASKPATKLFITETGYSTNVGINVRCKYTLRVFLEFMLRQQHIRRAYFFELMDTDPAPLWGLIDAQFNKRAHYFSIQRFLALYADSGTPSLTPLAAKVTAPTTAKLNYVLHRKSNGRYLLALFRDIVSTETAAPAVSVTVELTQPPSSVTHHRPTFGMAPVTIAPATSFNVPVTDEVSIVEIAL